MLNFDDFGLNANANRSILLFAPRIYRSSISVLANRVNKNDIDELIDVFHGKINLHVDLVEGPFLRNHHKPHTLEDISIEILTQLQKLLDYGIRPQLIDFHQNAHKKINVMRALIAITSDINQYQLRPLIQSPLMRGFQAVFYKNIGAFIAQRMLHRWVKFSEGVVVCGLDSFPHNRWPELFKYVTSDHHILPCHPHLYESEKLFSEYIAQHKNAYGTANGTGLDPNGHI